jgi:hypothetical protein
MAYHDIRTPRGTIVVTPNGKAELTWNTSFKNRWEAVYSVAQKYVDSEVLRRCAPLVPLRTGMLVQSGILGTFEGSGLVQYIAPYSKAQYYMKRKVGSETGTQRGSFWFERMKAVHKQSILDEAQKKMRGTK